MKPTPENGSQNTESIHPMVNNADYQEVSAKENFTESLERKYKEWGSFFGSFDISNQAEQWVISPDGPGVEKFYSKVDDLVSLLSHDTSLAPLLKKYRFFINAHEGATLASSASYISVGAKDLMKQGSEAIAGMIKKEILAAQASPDTAPQRDEEQKQESVNDAAAGAEKEKNDAVHVGDVVQWEHNGTIRFETPKKIERIEHDPHSGKPFAFFEGENTGVPLDELVVENPKSKLSLMPDQEKLNDAVSSHEGPASTEGAGPKLVEKNTSEAVGEHSVEDATAAQQEKTTSTQESQSERGNRPPETHPNESATHPFESAEQHIDPSTFRLRSRENLYGESGAQWKRRVMDTVSRLKENFYVQNIVDWAKIAYNSALDDWHTGFAVARKADLNERLTEIRNLEEGYRHLTTEQDRFRREGGVSEKVLMDVEKDRAEQERKIEQKKNEADKIQSKLEYRNNQRARYENARAAASERFMTRVQEKLGPFEEKLFELKKTREQLASEISHHRSLMADYQDRMDLLQKKINQEQFPSLRRRYREAMKEIQRINRDIMSEVAAREKDMSKIDKRIVRYDHKANPWRDKYNELARITKRKGPDTSVARRTIFEESSSEIHTVEGHPRTDADRNGTIVPDSGIVPTETGLLDPELLEKYSPEDFVKAWNSMNGSRMTINPATAKKNFPHFFDKENISVDEGWQFAEFYAERSQNEDRHAGMPSMEGSARKRRKIGFWARLFGRSGRAKGRRRLLAFLDKK